MLHDLPIPSIRTSTFTVGHTRTSRLGRTELCRATLVCDGGSHVYRSACRTGGDGTTREEYHRIDDDDGGVTLIDATAHAATDYGPSQWHR